jgi:tetratricopeptide (TPR) repeat protein
MRLFKRVLSKLQLVGGWWVAMSGKNDLSLALFMRAKENNSASFAARYAIVIADCRSTRSEQALEEAKELTGLFPEQPKSYYARAVAKAANHFNDGALNDIQYVLSLKRWRRAEKLQIIILLSLGRVEESRTLASQYHFSFKKFSRYLPDSSQSWLVEVQNLVDGGHVSEAQRTLEEIIARDQEDGNALVRLGEIWEQRGNFDTAIQLYSRALAIDRKSVYALSCIARAYCSSGNYQLAVRYAKKARRRDPNLGLPYFILADAYERGMSNRVGMSSEVRKLRAQGTIRGRGSLLRPK